MLRIAVPNKGALSEASAHMLREAGYHLRSNTKTLVHRDSENDVEFFYLRPRDIAVYVGSGILDLGITGSDLLAESAADAHQIMELGFGSSRFHYAALPGTFNSVHDLEGKRIATSFPTLVKRHLKKNSVKAETVKLDGAVEVSIELGVADAIADVVETGSTLRQAGLETFGEPIMHSQGVLIARDGVKDEDLPERARVLLRRLKSVSVARTYVMMDYDIRVTNLERATELTPGLESPTVSTLQDPEWCAVRSMVQADNVHAVMDKLYDVGARAILVTNIGACRI